MAITVNHYHRTNKESGNKPVYYGKGHFRLINNSDTDTRYSPDGSNYFTLPKRLASNVPIEIQLFDCSRLVVETSFTGGSGSIYVFEIPLESFTSINYLDKNKLY